MTSRITLLPDDIISQIVGFGGINIRAETALRAIQRRWRAVRNIARRRAAYIIQFRAIGYDKSYPELAYEDQYRNDLFTDLLVRIRRFNRLRTALRGENSFTWN